MPTVVEKIQEALNNVKRDLALLHCTCGKKPEGATPNMVALIDQVLEQLKKSGK